jgi:hypothetical protein
MNIRHYYYYYYYYVPLLSTGFPGTSPLEPVMNPTIQASSLTFLMMCVPSMAIFLERIY